MTQDYQRKRVPPPPVSIAPKKRLRCLFSVLMAFFVGYFTASFYSPQTLLHRLSDYLDSQTKQAEQPKSTAETTLPKPKFEFYNMLTGEQIQHQQAKAPVVEPVQVTKTALYRLQVASFKTLQDADHLKASLVLKGYDVTVTQVPNGSTLWYRVSVGPYQTLSQIEKAQVAIMRSDKMMGIIRKEALA